ncbi:hypothetical protein C8J57DRAFT_630883 [Mycena rebaudengoi]|nr:hypothetical protein C8J57DRAFT_630883 [Mycena rebaudengoi]
MFATTGHIPRNESGMSPATPPESMMEGQASDDDSNDANMSQANTAHVSRVRITPWRLLNTVVLLALGISKSILILRGKTGTSNDLDWIMGIAWVLVGYWVSLVEQEAPSIAPSFFACDLTTPLSHGFRFAFGLFMLWLLLAVDILFAVGGTHWMLQKIEILEPAAILAGALTAVALFMLGLLLLFITYWAAKHLLRTAHSLFSDICFPHFLRFSGNIFESSDWIILHNEDACSHAC